MSIKSKINKQPSILVFGDFILDQYYWTSVSRISPEAPVPICHIQNTTYCLGGAGNVANNLSVFGAEVSVAGIIGNDENGNVMQSHFKAANINSDLVVSSNNYPTICKSRVIAKGQQLCRLDHEDTSIDIESTVQAVLDQLYSSACHYDAIVMSDYGKGVISEYLAKKVIEFANQHKVPVIVDPKGHQASKYNGATFITPNMSEFKELTGLKNMGNENEIKSSGQQLIQDHNIDYLILTRSEKGMNIISKEDHQHYPTKAMEVSDVTGAGDTVVAAIAFGAALQLDQKTIINFANHAAGVVVSKVGTATATLEEIDAYESRF